MNIATIHFLLNSLAKKNTKYGLHLIETGITQNFNISCNQIKLTWLKYSYDSTRG